MQAPAIGPMADAREADVLAGWIWNEWARHEPGISREASDRAVHEALGCARLPHFVVGRVDSTPIGCASIVATDLPTHPDLGPWLANVYVLPDWRGRGVGAALVARAMAHGAQVAPRLYLYTFGRPGWYERLGWRACDTGEYAGRSIVIMRYDVPARERVV